MGNQANRSRVSGIGVLVGLAIALSIGGGSSHAEKGEWIVTLEPMQMTAYGHDQHVLTIHEIDLGPPQADDKTAVGLETEAGPALRSSVQYKRGQWAWGADLFWFTTPQDTPSRTASAEGAGGTIDEVVFEIADRDFTSTDPSEVLFYDRLTDTDIAVWTFDAYAMRTLADKPDSGIDLQFGLRLGDFDNDYHAAVGSQGVTGTLVDASSNYDRMMGPLVGLRGDIRRGRNSFEGYIGQSVLIGSVSLSNAYSDFTGPADMPTFTALQSFHKDEDVAIPVTELRFKWTYRVSKNVALGAGANASTWWDVAVPPGILPVPGGDATLHENTIVLVGFAAAIDLTF